MDKFERHLQFLVQVAGYEDKAKEAFSLKKRDVRKALAYLLEEVHDREVLFQCLEGGEASSEVAQQLLLTFVPNRAYKGIMKRLRQREFSIDTLTQEKLQKFKRPPSAETIERIFSLLKKVQVSVAQELLAGLHYFGPNLKPQLMSLQLLSRSEHLLLSQQALSLIGVIPGGMAASMPLVARLLREPSRRFSVLTALQEAKDLPHFWLIQLFKPLIDAYRLEGVDTNVPNTLREEFQLIRSICLRNGLSLTIPYIDIIK